MHFVDYFKFGQIGCIFLEARLSCEKMKSIYSELTPSIDACLVVDFWKFGNCMFIEEFHLIILQFLEMLEKNIIVRYNLQLGFPSGKNSINHKHRPRETRKGCCYLNGNEHLLIRISDDKRIKEFVIAEKTDRIQCNMITLTGKWLLNHFETRMLQEINLFQLIANEISKCKIVHRNNNNNRWNVRMWLITNCFLASKP